MLTTVETFGTWARMVKFSHTIFALPFAFSGATLAAADGGWEWRSIGWIVVAMFGARNAAMGFNRLVDRHFDAANPRTASRELPQGKLSPMAVWIFTAALSGLFVVAAFQLSPLCGWLSPLALAIVFGYSFTKRFTWASHVVLGLGLAMAPVGAWLAIRGTMSWTAGLLGLSVMLWVAGFDVVYACQDAEFDRRAGLASIPARFGIRRALLLARGLHVAALAAMTAVGLTAGLSQAYWVGLVLIALIMIWEHRLVREEDLSKLGVAFFNMNGLISVLYFLAILSSVLLDTQR